MKGIRLLTTACAAALASGPALAADPYFESVLAAVSDASGQGDVYLAAGRYRAENAGTRLTLEIPADIPSTLQFQVLNRSVQSADWTFRRPVFLTIERGGHCVRLEVRRLRFRAGGAPDPDSSDTTMRAPAGNPNCNDSEAVLALDDVFSTTADMTQFLRGGIYNSLSSTRRCTNDACTATAAGHPIRRARFYSTAQAAFSAGFQEGSSVILPRQGYLRLTEGSAATFNAIDYNFVDGRGTAELRSLVLGVSEGVIAGGTTNLRLAAGAQVRLDQFNIGQANGRFEMRNGSVRGRLGEGTIVSFGGEGGRTSSVLLINADTDIAGMNLTSEGTRTSLSIQRGQFQTSVKSADLWLSSNANVRLEYANVNFLLGCPEGAPTGCLPVEWGSDRTVVHGTIREFATNITGGQFALSNAGTTRIMQGRIQAGPLLVDSTQAVTPITGPVNRLELRFAGEDLILDDRTRVGTALVTLISSDLRLVQGQALPVGTLDLEGTVTRVQGGALGRITTGDGTLSMRIVRRDNDAPEVVDGRLDARSQIRLEGVNNAAGTIQLRDLRYYMGHGSARLRLTVDEAQYVVRTPSGHRTESNDFARAEVNLRPVDLTVRLAEPFVVGPIGITSSQSNWTLEPALAVPLRLAVAVPRHELVYAPIKERVTGSTLCAPKVYLTGQTIRLGASVDLFAGSSGGRVRVYDATSSGPVDVDVDDNGCSEVAALVCGVIGSLGGPFGAVALAAVCSRRVEDEEARLEEQIRGMSTSIVERFRFDFDF